MRKQTKEYTSKTVKELEKSVISLREEIARFQLQKKVNPQKDSNMVSKKKRQLAVMLTIIQQKKELEKVQK